MPEYPTTDDFRRIVVAELPLIDVRAPGEFQGGAFPGAVNLPILDDNDRHLVGRCYKHQGREAAFALARKRVSGAVREARLQAWRSFLEAHPEAMIYCFRGGMRSRTAQQWLAEQGGTAVTRLAGGYKAFRRYLIEALDPRNIVAEPVILGGRTGVGKTILLGRLDNALDLEAIAHHRGSAFGAHLTPQPGQIDFENRLAYGLIRHARRGYRYLILEDEGSYIGARYIPHQLAAYFKRDAMVILESDLASRSELTYREYVVLAQEQYQAVHGAERGVELWYEATLARLQRIRKRLGGERFKRVGGLLDGAHAAQRATGEASAHRRWVELLLREYYDPMYDYQIQKSGRRILFKGGFEEVLAYLGELERSAAGESGTP